MKILLVEDSYIERTKLGSFLTDWGYEWKGVGSGTEAVKLLDGPNPPELALLDWVLPGLDGIDVLRRIRKLTQGNYIYTVMLTAKTQKKDRLMAMEAGADDYLSKPVDPMELRSRIAVGKRILDLQQSLRFAATHDFLTTLLNRSEILAALEREVARGARDDKPATVILADIDHFKRINDTMGHAAGDEVLKEVARRLKQDLRPYDVVGRYGGEEFLLILPGCNLANGVKRADEIRTIVSGQPITTPSGTISVTVSMGVTASDNSRYFMPAEFLQEADASLYKAKNNGRNRVEAFVPLAKSSSAGQR
ncbi:MAG TPA: diguanylate cyclase [Candidatus Eisenbacteria bacterium]|nr:diguanylate cyclase [Candidatus Eisenbacteria bacterium]